MSDQAWLAIIDFVIKYLPATTICFILGMVLMRWLMKRQPKDEVNDNNNDNGKNNGKVSSKVNGVYVTERLCRERNERIGDNMQRLQKADDRHFAFQKENINELHKLDKKMDNLDTGLKSLIDHHKINHVSLFEDT